MEIIPAIDLHGGKCVRLLRGERSRETIYSDNPAEIARKWQSLGARRLHMVDLDGAFAGERVNAAAISDVASALDIPTAGRGYPQQGNGTRYL